MRLAPQRLFGRGRKRRPVLVMVGVVVVAAGIGGWILLRPGSSTAQTQALTYTVSKTTLKQTVSASGSLEAAKEADLDFAVSGTVTHVYVKAGQKVAKGQALARIDDTTLQAAYQSAKAALAAAQTAYSDDASAGVSSTQLASDSAQIASATASLSQAAKDLADATLRATISGTVASTDLAVGDTVSGSSAASGSGGGAGTGAGAGTGSSSSSTSAFVVIQPGRFVVTAAVSADDISSVKTGMQVTLTTGGSSTSSGGGGFGGFPGGLTVNRSGAGSATTSDGSSSSTSSRTSTIFGTVTSVSMVADTSGSTTTFPVTVTVTGLHKNLYAGTSVTAAITTKQLTDVLVVPALALSSSNGKTYVEKVVDGLAVQTEVTVGQTYGSQTEITKGLSSGDTIRLAVGGFTRTSNSSSGSGGSRFPGGGFPAGGLPARGFGGGQ